MSRSIAAALLLGLTACGAFSTQYYCTYEKRTSGCNNYSYGPWTAECYSFDIEDYVEGWTPEDVCNIYTGSDLHCASTCCIDTEYRGSTLHSGQCP